MDISYRIPDRDTLKRQKEQILERIYGYHLRKWGGSLGNVFFISDTYPGVWLEHSYDGVSWADYMPSEHVVSKNHINLFLDKQTSEGQLPCYIWKDSIGYGWTQECVSIGSVCIEAIAQNPDDPSFLKKCYDAVSRWVNWLYRTHMTQGIGLIEMFCGYDTGHDNSARFGWDGFKYDRAHRIDGVIVNGAVAPTDSDVLPMLAPDMNACFFGNLTSLSKMAQMLGLPEEKEAWSKKAEDVRRKMFELLYDEKDMFFYDVDKNGNKRKIRNISITNVLSEGVMDKELANAVFD